MTHPSRRYDGYARPLPDLTDASRQSLYERRLNVQARGTILAQLEEQYAALLRRGVYAELTLTVGIKDGVIMEEIRLGVSHTIRCEREE